MYKLYSAQTEYLLIRGIGKTKKYSEFIQLSRIISEKIRKIKRSKQKLKCKESHKNIKRRSSEDAINKCRKNLLEQAL